MSKKAFVLSSGGVDSTTCLSLAVKKFGAENVVSVSVNYGQKHIKELATAKKISDYYKVNHIILNIKGTGILDYGNCSLLQTSNQQIEKGTYKQQKEKKKVINTYVPFRNGLFLSMVSSLALSLYPDNEIEIYLGAHKDDEEFAYPDCSFEFTNAMNTAINLGTGRRVVVKTPFVNMSKKQIIKTGLELNTPYNLTWSCYLGEEKPCRECATCLDREKAFNENNLIDPILQNI